MEGREERKVNYGRRKISGTCSCEKLVRVAVDDSSSFSFFRNRFVFIFFLLEGTGTAGLAF